jgi:hypothetical protein
VKTRNHSLSIVACWLRQNAASMCSTLDLCKAGTSGLKGDGIVHAHLARHKFTNVANHKVTNSVDLYDGAPCTCILVHTFMHSYLHTLQ